MQLWMMQKKKNVLSKLDTRLDATETGKAAEERSSSVQFRGQNREITAAAATHSLDGYTKSSLRPEITTFKCSSFARTIKKKASHEI